MESRVFLRLRGSTNPNPNPSPNLNPNPNPDPNPNPKPNHDIEVEREALWEDESHVDMHPNGEGKETAQQVLGLNAAVVKAKEKWSVLASRVQTAEGDALGTL